MVNNKVTGCNDTKLKLHCLTNDQEPFEVKVTKGNSTLSKILSINAK